jgi:hypothetical protein
MAKYMLYCELQVVLHIQQVVDIPDFHLELRDVSAILPVGTTQ